MSVDPATDRRAASGTYVYAVTRGLDPGALEGVHGVGGEPVRLVGFPSGASDGDPPLQALVGDVDPSEFEGRALTERLEDLEWLGTTARAHHGVVASAGLRRPVVPLSLATVYLGDDRAREALTARAAVFTAALDRFAGRSEWGVKVFARRRPASGSRPRSTTGKDYLRARRAALREGAAEADEATRVAEDLHTAVAALAADARRHRLQDAALSGRSETMVLNGAYLIDDERAAEVTALIEAWSGDERVISAELTGPWVPYSFTATPVTEGSGHGDTDTMAAGHGEES